MGRTCKQLQKVAISKLSDYCLLTSMQKPAEGGKTALQADSGGGYLQVVWLLLE
jgi:hypothetical protein